MNRSSLRRALGFVGGVVMLMPTGLAAQRVAIEDDKIWIFNYNNDLEGKWDKGQIELWGDQAGFRGSHIRLWGRDILSPHVVLDGRTGDAFFGGGVAERQDGDIILRDTDGQTTTINLQGEFGFIQLGSPDDDGDLRLWDNSPDNEFSINLDGGSGNVTNQLGGNGLVKAWAKIHADGTVAACWRCNTDPAETRKTNTGFYEVDFNPLGTDLSGRLALCSPLSSAKPTFSVCDFYALSSTAYVQMFDTADAFRDAPFKVVIF